MQRMPIRNVSTRVCVMIDVLNWCILAAAIGARWTPTATHRVRTYRKLKALSQRLPAGAVIQIINSDTSTNRNHTLHGLGATTAVEASAMQKTKHQ